MTDITPDARPTRRTLPRISFTASVGVALLLGAAGYGFGHYQAADTKSASSTTCTTAQHALKQQSDTVKAGGDDNAMRVMAHLVVQNGQCFSPQLAATAQTLLDRLDQGATAVEIRGALCAAPSNPWWSC